VIGEAAELRAESSAISALDDGSHLWFFSAPPKWFFSAPPQICREIA